MVFRSQNDHQMSHNGHKDGQDGYKDDMNGHMDGLDQVSPLVHVTISLFVNVCNTVVC